MIECNWFTEEEHLRLSRAGDEFARRFGEVAADIIGRFPPELETAVTYHLQDCASLFSPLVYDVIQANLKKRGLR